MEPQHNGVLQRNKLRWISNALSWMKEDWLKRLYTYSIDIYTTLWKRQNYRGRKRKVVVKIGVQRRSWEKRHVGNFLKWQTCFVSCLSWWFVNYMYLSKTIQLYTSKNTFYCKTHFNNFFSIIGFFVFATISLLASKKNIFWEGIHQLWSIFKGVHEKNKIKKDEECGVLPWPLPLVDMSFYPVNSKCQLRAYSPLSCFSGMHR